MRCFFLTGAGWKYGYIMDTYKRYGDVYHNVKGDDGTIYSGLIDWKVKPVDR